jgi:hypothetical protein
MNPTVPPMPDEAAPWALVQALGKPTLAKAWEGCFAAGREVGYAHGFGTAVMYGLVGLIALLLVVVLIRETRS